MIIPKVKTEMLRYLLIHFKIVVVKSLHVNISNIYANCMLESIFKKLVVRWHCFTFSYLFEVWLNKTMRDYISSLAFSFLLYVVLVYICEENLASNRYVDSV